MCTVWVYLCGAVMLVDLISAGMRGAIQTLLPFLHMVQYIITHTYLHTLQNNTDFLSGTLNFLLCSFYLSFSLILYMLTLSVSSMYGNSMLCSHSSLFILLIDCSDCLPSHTHVCACIAEDELVMTPATLLTFPRVTTNQPTNALRP